MAATKVLGLVIVLGLTIPFPVSLLQKYAGLRKKNQDNC